MTDRPASGDGAAAESSILAVHCGALGDVILFGRLLRRLGGTVTLVAGGQKGKLLAGAGMVAAALDFDALPMHEIFSDTLPDQCRLPALLGVCDRLVSCFATDNRAAEHRLAAMCGAGDAAFLPVRPGEGFRGHLLELWADLLGLDCDGTSRQPWPLPDSWKADARNALAGAGAESDRPYVVIHPGAGSTKKCWPLERFVELARLIRGEKSAAGTDCSRQGPTVVFVLGPAERQWWERSTVEALAREFPLILSPPLTTLAGLLAAAAGYVGNDSGVSHLAAAVGTPSVVLFGPTRPEHFAPVGAAVAVISARSLAEISTEEASHALADLR